jgi:succinate dehydrogenase/fumarate reductase-like Fe-S protein
MVLTGRARAWINLAYRFGRHVVVRMPARVLRGSDDLRLFLEAVEPEGYIPLTAEERVLLPATMNCVHCGLCSLACPVLKASPSDAWAEAWTFVAGPSRSIDRVSLAVHDMPPCVACDACTAICPMDIPIPQLAALVRRMAEPQHVET